VTGVVIVVLMLELTAPHIVVCMWPWSMTGVYRGDAMTTPIIAVFALGSFHCGVRAETVCIVTRPLPSESLFTVKLAAIFIYTVLTFATNPFPSQHTTKWLSYPRNRAWRRMRQKHRRLFPCLLPRPCAAFLQLHTVTLLCDTYCRTRHRRVSSKG
jgi:hypothetical protein